MLQCGCNQLFPLPTSEERNERYDGTCICDCAWRFSRYVPHPVRKAERSFGSMVNGPPHRAGVHLPLVRPVRPQHGAVAWLAVRLLGSVPWSFLSRHTPATKEEALIGDHEATTPVSLRERLAPEVSFRALLQHSWPYANSYVVAPFRVSGIFNKVPCLG
jgi:hypothetical protein